MEDKDNPQEDGGREMETHTRFHGRRNVLEHREARPRARRRGAAHGQNGSPEKSRTRRCRIMSVPRDVDIVELDSETRKKRRITFKERPTHEDEDDHGKRHVTSVIWRAWSSWNWGAVANGGGASKD